MSESEKWNDRGEWIGGFTQYPDYENRESREIEDAIAAMHAREMRRIKMAETEPAPVAQVNLYDVSDKMYFAIHLGTADYNGEEMRLAVTTGGEAILLEFKGKQFKVDVSEIGAAIQEMVNGKPE